MRQAWRSFWSMFSSGCRAGERFMEGVEVGANIFKKEVVALDQEMDVEREKRLAELRSA